MARTTRQVPEGDSLVLNALWGALRVFRPAALVYAAWSVWVRHDDMVNLPGAVGVLAGLGVWTAYMYAAQRRDLAIHLAEMFVGGAAIMSTRFFDTPLSITTGDTTIPGVWQHVPVVGVAIILGWRGGLAAALVITAVMVAQVGRLDSEPIANAGLVVMLGMCIGYAADTARKEQAALRRILAQRAEVAERERLARVVHDGVLQALAFIHRRGLDIGGETARLAVLAGDQESALRALASGIPLVELEAVVDGPVDLRTALQAAAADRAGIEAPSEPVDMDPRRAHEIVAAVAAALDNVRQHAGAGARARVQVEDLGADVVVTVHDDGVGVSEQELVEAQGRGRLGVSSSIRGRIEDLGGRATYRPGPGGGTIVHMWVPKEAR
jgi:signal transduction histidine kinase